MEEEVLGGNVFKNDINSLGITGGSATDLSDESLLLYPGLSSSQIKAKQLAEASFEKAQRLRTKQQEIREANSVFTDYEVEHNAAIRVLNTGGNVVNTAVDVGTGIVGIPDTVKKFTAPAVDQFSKLNDRFSEIIRESLPIPVNKAINTAASYLKPGLDNASIIYNFLTPKTETLAHSLDGVKAAIKPLYNPVVAERVQTEAADAWNSNTGVIDTAGGIAKVIGDNPIAAGEMFIGMLPYMMSLASKGSIGATAFMGTVSENYKEAEKKFIASHNGLQPNSQESSIMMGAAFIASGVEKAEALFVMNKLPIPSILPKVASVPVKGVANSATEFAQEGSQSLLTDIGGYQDKLLDNPKLQAEIIQRAGEAGSVGAVVGGVGGAGMKVLDSTASGEALAAISKVGDVATKAFDNTVGKTVRDYADNYTLTDEQISKDALGGIKVLRDKPFTSTNPSEFKEEFDAFIQTAVKLRDSSSRNEKNDAEFNSAMQEIVTRASLFREQLSKVDYTKALDEVSTATKNQRNENSVLGSSIRSNIPVIINNIEKLTVEQLDTLANPNSALSTEERAIIVAYKSAKSMNEVTDNIKVTTNGKKVSLLEHSNNIALGIAAKNRVEARNALVKLNTFANAFANKAAQVARASIAVNAHNSTVKSISIPQIDPKATPLEIRAGKYSAGLVASIDSDNKTIQATLAKAKYQYKQMLQELDKAQKTNDAKKVVEPAVTTKPVVEPKVTAETPQTESTSASNKISKFKAGAYKVSGSVLSQAAFFYKNAIKNKLKPKEFEDISTKTVKAIATKPNYSFGPTIFTENNSVIDLIGQNDLLKDASLNIRAIAEAIAASIYGNHPDNKGTMLQDFLKNPAIVFMEQVNGNSLVANPTIMEAIAIVAYNHIGTQAGSLMFNSPFTIRRMLGKDSKEDLPREAKILNYAGTNINNLADTLGAEIMSILDMKIQREDNSDTSIDKKRMQHALGFIAIKGLLDTGYVQQNVISKTEYDALFEKDEDTIEGQTDINRVVFISVPIVRDKNGKVELQDKKVMATKHVQKVRDEFKVEEFKKAMRDIISLKDNEISPITKKVRGIPKFLKNTFQLLSETAKVAVKTANEREYSFNTTAFDKFLEMYNDPELTDALLTSLGYTHDLDAETEYTRDSKEAANILIRREIEELLEFKKQIDIKNKKIFYFNHDVWKNSRMGMSSDSGINPQASKLVRHFVNLSSFDKTLDSKLQGEQRIAAIRAMKISIAAGLDIDPAKKGGDGALELLNMELNNPTSALAIAITTPNNKNIIAMMQKYGLKSHSLESFLALQEVLLYEVGTKESITVRTALEIDGKTNGVAISLAQFFGIENQNELEAILKSVGIFTKESDTQYLEATKGEEDLYEQISVAWDGIVSKVLTNIRTGNYNKNDAHLWLTQHKYIGNITNDGKVDKAAREASKYPFMKTIFGQSINRLKLDFGNELVARIYKKVEQLGIDRDNNVPEEIISGKLDEINADILVLTGVKGTFNTENFMKHMLSADILNKIAESASETYGVALADAINNKFSSFYALRDSLNSSVASISDLFIALVENKARALNVTITNELLNTLMHDSISKGGLAEFLPSIRTVHSKTLLEGFIALKKSNKRSANEDNKVQVNYAEAFPIINNPISFGSIDPILEGDTTSHTGGITEIALENAGVGTMIGLLHSFDGAQMQTIITAIDAFGIHDAWLFNALDAESHGKELNRIFKEQNEQYSIAEAIKERLEEIKELVVKESGKSVPENIAKKFIEEYAIVTTGTDKKLSINYVASTVEEARKDWFGRIKNWAQFVFDNSGYPAEFTEEAVVEPSLDILEPIIPISDKDYIQLKSTEHNLAGFRKKNTVDAAIAKLSKFTTEELAKLGTVTPSIIKSLKCRKG